MQIELSKMSKIAGNWGNSTNVKISNLLNPLESFILCALATKDVFAWMNPNRLSTTTSLISMQMISTNWT